MLAELSPRGFHHNEQSLRVVDHLERQGRGLNLTWEVRDGILNHSKTHSSLLEEDWGKTSTLEGDICRLADIVAYVNHDTEDAVRAGAISERDVPLGAVTVLGMTNSERINTMVTDVIQHSWATSGRAPGPVHIGMSPEVLRATDMLREFLFSHVYNVRSAHEESELARETIRRLYRYFVRHEDRLPPEYRLIEDDPQQRVIDYIAGMTDRYALRTAADLDLLPPGVRPSRLFVD